MNDNIALAWTGASGMPYGLRLLECLLAADYSVDLLISDAARIVLKMETDMRLPPRPRDTAAALAEHYDVAAGRIRVYGTNEWTAPMASGSGAASRMVVCPCTTGALAAIAAGMSDNLIERAADVVLKEGGKLVLVPRETPFSQLHLENMLRLSRMGVVILPPNPGFYHHPTSIADLVDFVVARILDHLGIPNALIPRWGHQDEEPTS